MRPLARCALLLVAVLATACTTAAPSAETRPTETAGVAAPPVRATDTAPTALGAAPVPAAVQTAPPAPRTVRLGLMYSSSDAGLLVALEKGYFQEQAIEVELEQFNAAAQLLPALSAAQIDVGATAVTPGYLNAFA